MEIIFNAIQCHPNKSAIAVITPICEEKIDCACSYIGCRGKIMYGCF